MQATVTDLIRQHLLQSLGIPGSPTYGVPLLESLRQSEWSSQFEQLMRNRLVMGAFRHYCLHDPRKPAFDRMADIARRVERYRETQNKEL